MRARSRPTTGSKYRASRPILLVHGFASTEAVLAPLARHLSRTLRRKAVWVGLGVRISIIGVWRLRAAT